MLNNKIKDKKYLNNTLLVRKNSLTPKSFIYCCLRIVNQPLSFFYQFSIFFSLNWNKKKYIKSKIKILKQKEL